MDEVLSGFDLQDCSATGSFMSTTKLFLVHSRGEDFEFFLNAFLQYARQQTAIVGDVHLMNVKKALDMRVAPDGEAAPQDMVSTCWPNQFRQ